MKTALVWIAVILACLTTSETGFADQPVRVLFVGNSFTAINDLPQLTAQLAASARPPRALESEFVGEGGATLKRHWETGRALEAIRRGKWDYVVLQEQGTLGHSDDFVTISDPAMFHSYARLFDAEITKAGAKTLFFLTWARRDSPQSQALLTNAYVSIAAELHAPIAPVGIAWQNALKENPAIVLHHADRSHPGPAGSYLAAAVFYAVLFSSSPEGLSHGDLRKEDAPFLQRIAWQTVRDPRGSLSAAKSETPEAVERGQAILSAAQKAAGGLERLRGLDDLTVTVSGKISSPQGDLPFEGREIMVFPGVIRTDMKLPFGEMASFFDGSSGWRRTPQGVSDLPDRMKKILRAQHIRHTINLLRAEGEISVRFEKRQTLGESEADVILMTMKGEEVRLFVDPAGALLKKTFQGIGTGGPAEIDETYFDYREVAGIRLPFRIVTHQNGARFVEATIHEVKFNSGVDVVELGKRPE